jgi:hypothetical protein
LMPTTFDLDISSEMATLTCPPFWSSMAFIQIMTLIALLDAFSTDCAKRIRLSRRRHQYEWRPTSTQEDIIARTVSFTNCLLRWHDRIVKPGNWDNLRDHG